ncbi:Sugar (and other) transporter [Geosmithia morbida]|uniref:Sugar (And other) transporter n=1 Tax=Geosmithia morbida TaxID=1094350 RepID=A0A9P4Z051_9HYPO|nr:Sugar (and other) transporter [Geosmithia morbida]KAF4126261.1 Sugar (and other) transporter [Geosmithia morbida]
MSAVKKFFAPMRMSLTSALVISVCVVDSVTIAYDGSLMGSLNVMPSYNKYFEISSRTQGIMSGATFAGACVVAPMTSKLINYKGRKLGILISALMNILGAALGGAAQNMPMFIAARVIVGMGVGIAQTSAASYVSETTAPDIRGFALGMYFTCWALGSFLATGVCRGATNLEPSNWAWRLPSLLQGAIPCMVICVLFFVPESPRWLCYSGREEEALQSLELVTGAHRDSPVVQAQLREIIDTLEYERTFSHGIDFRETFRTPANRRRVLLAVSVGPLAMLTGSNVITYYFGTMLSQAGITSETKQLEINLGLSAWQFIAALTGSLLADRIGRRGLALISLGTCTIFFYILGGLTAAYGESENKPGVYATVATIYLYLGAYSFGITPLTSMYGPEVLSYSIRASGIACYAVGSELSGFFVTMVFPIMFDNIGWRTYMINASWNVLLWIFVYFMWVETKGLTLEEVSEIFDGQKHSTPPDLAEIQDKEAGIVITTSATDMA